MTDTESGSCTEKWPRPSGEGPGRGPRLRLGPARVPQPQPPAGSRALPERGSGQPAARDRPQARFPQHSEETKTPGNCSPTSSLAEVSSLPEAAGVARHNSPLRPATPSFPGSPFRTGPGTSRLGEREQRFPQHSRQGNVFAAPRQEVTSPPPSGPPDYE